MISSRVQSIEPTCVVRIRRRLNAQVRIALRVFLQIFLQILPDARRQAGKSPSKDVHKYFRNIGMNLRFVGVRVSRKNGKKRRTSESTASFCFAIVASRSRS
jgi:hypothetical protein